MIVCDMIKSPLNLTFILALSYIVFVGDLSVAVAVEVILSSGNPFDFHEETLSHVFSKYLYNGWNIK